MIMHDGLTSLLFHVNQHQPPPPPIPSPPPPPFPTPNPHPHAPALSSNKAISNFDLETTRSKSWLWPKGNAIQSAQYLIDFFSFCFTSIRYQFLRYSYFEIWPSKIPRSRSRVRSKVKSRSHSSPSIQQMHLLILSHQADQPFLRYVQ